jgi:hypothetical protein
MTERRVSWAADAAWLLVLGGLSAAWCATAGGRLGATFDEPYFLTAGLESWRTGTAKPLIDTGTMPLPMYVATAPLYWWERSRGRPFDPAAEMDTMLAVARLGTLVFWLPLLAYALVAGRLLAGPWAGRLAAALIAGEPTFLAHASLATADVAVVAGVLAFWVHFRLGRERSWAWRVGLPAFLFAVALFAKVSALPFCVLGMVVLELDRRLRELPEGTAFAGRLAAAWRGLTAAPFRRDAVQVGLVALVLVFVFCGSDWKPSPSFVKWADGLPDGRGATAMRWLANHLCIFSNAGNALAYQIRHNMRGHTTYLLGTSWPRAVWYYFPVALSIKLTLSLLALPLLLAAVSPRSLRNWACGLALVLFLFSLNCRVQTGVRFMLPLLTATAVGAAAALVTAVRDAGPGWRRRLLVSAGVVAPLWAGGSALAVWPHGLCYTNELWGGTPEGYRLLSDSNYDWGQGLRELRAWQDGHGPVSVWYFGTDPAIWKPPLHLVRLHDVPQLRPETVRAQCPTPYLAVGTTLLYGSMDLIPRVAPIIHSLRGVRPVARTTTFLIFDVNDLPAASADRGSGEPGA